MLKIIKQVLFFTLKKEISDKKQISFKFDQTFTETDVLRPEQIYMKNYVLSNEDYNITIK